MQDPDFTNDCLVQIFLQCRRQGRANQSDRGVLRCDHQKRRRVTPERLLFVFRDIMAYSEFVKGMAVGLMRVWRNARRVSRELSIHHKTIQRRWLRWNEGEGPGRRVGSGRPRKTTNATNRKLIIACKRNRFVPVPKLTVSWNFASGVNCNVRTVYRRLAEAGIRSYRPAVRIPLTPRHKNLRKRWCRDQSRRRLDEWRTVMWSDESRFTLDFHDGRNHVHRLRGERFAPCCLQEHDRYGGGSVLVWAAIWHGRRSPLCIVDGMMTGQKHRELKFFLESLTFL